MLYLLTGEDDFSLSQNLAEIKNSVRGSESFGANTITFDGLQVDLDELRIACTTVPFLAEKRLVIVRGLLGRFESGTKSRSSGRSKTAAREPRKKDDGRQETLLDILTNIPESTVVVLVEGKLSGTSPVFKGLAGKAVVKTFPPLKDSGVGAWMEKLGRGAGGSISPQARMLLSRLVGNNLWSLSSEINKLVLFAAGRRIEEEDVRTLVSQVQQASIFTLVDAVIDSRAEVAAPLLQGLLQSGVAPAFVLFMLARQAQLLVRVAELNRQGKSKAEIQSRLGLSSDYVVQKALDQAGRYPLTRVKLLYEKLLETDLAIKTGQYDGELALSILITELCQRPAQATGVTRR